MSDRNTPISFTNAARSDIALSVSGLSAIFSNISVFLIPFKMSSGLSDACRGGLVENWRQGRGNDGERYSRCEENVLYAI